MHSNLDYPNYKNEKSLSTINEDIIEVDSIDGFSLILNRDKFANDELFDENFFLYLENDDLCLRAKKKIKKYILLKVH